MHPVALYSRRPNTLGLFHNATSAWPFYHLSQRRDSDSSIFDWGLSEWHHALPSTRASTTETDESYVISIEVPGIPQENISISLEENVLKITGEHHESRTTTNKKESNSSTDGANDDSTYHRSHGHVSYAYRLPTTGVDHAKVMASLENGLLQVTVPKITPVLPTRRTIAINGGNTPREGSSDAGPTARHDNA